jgi:PAS domain S-box-containing protein
MKKPVVPKVTHRKPDAIPIRFSQIEGREWWLWSFAVVVTLVLTGGIVSFTIPGFHMADSLYWADLKDWVRALAALVLLFDIYTVYQHLQLHRIRRQLAERDELFRLLSENAADMIALVDSKGRRLYNSPAYQTVLGYSAEELNSTSAMEQIHLDDRQRLLEATEKARITGRGERLEYRIRHKDGSWRILESTASAIQNAKGETEKFVIVNRDITERKRVEGMLAHNAFHDPLTNLPNRSLFQQRLQHALVLSKRHPDYKFAVLLIDVDEFKVVNDSLGHLVGDELLVLLAQRLTVSLRRLDTISRPRGPAQPELATSDDTLARLGGDEFTVLLDDIRSPSDAVRVAERIQSKLASPFVINGQEIVIAASIGIVSSGAQYGGAEEVLRDADIAMYRAKRQGKARCQVFDAAMHASALQRLQLETDLRKAVDRGELLVFYQPIVSLENGKITGFEALSRWDRPGGVAMPAEFIAIADETGLILPMNRQLLREACQQLKSWQAQFPSEPPLTMSVNVTAKQFAQPDLAGEIRGVLTYSGIDPGALQLEITETIAMGDAERSSRVLSELHALGVRLSIDDFGTGYSSLSRLQSFPFDTLKIDRAFISGANADADSGEIVRVIVTLAHNLGMKVVAEGTETIEQLNHLKDLQCELAQGYYFARPVPPVEASKLLLHGFSAKAHA